MLTRSRSALAALAGLFLLAASAGAIEPKTAKEAAAKIEDGKVKAHVEALADPSLKGRVTGTQGADTATAYIAKAFKEAGLSVLPGEKELVLAQSGEKNVVGIAPGSDKKDEAIVVSAHWDGMETEKKELVPGADDNASGLAALLELARVLGPSSGVKPRRTIVFAAFGGYWDWDDNKRFRGAKAFLKTAGEGGKIAGSKPVFQIGLMNLGLALLPAHPERFFAFGPESSKTALAALKELGGEMPESTITRCSVDLIEKLGPRDDYDAFRAAKVPFLFFTSGVSKHYHKPTDTVAIVDPKRVAQAARLATALVGKVDAQDAAPEFAGETLRDDKSDATEVLGIIEAALAKDSGLVMTDKERRALELKQEKVKDMIDSTEITARDRAQMKEALGLLLVILLK